MGEACGSKSMPVPLQANAYLGGSTMINNRHIEAWLGSDDPGAEMPHNGRQIRREINGSTAMQTASGMANRPANEAELLHANAKVEPSFSRHF